MGELIRFPIERARRNGGKLANRETSDNVVIFEGIRYCSETANHANEELQRSVEPTS